MARKARSAESQRQLPANSSPAAGLVPQERELLDACFQIKSIYPKYGVKRVFNEVVSNHPEWNVTERRVQRLMRAHALTVQQEQDPLPPEPPQPVPLFPEDCVCLVKRKTHVGWVLRAAGALGGDEYDDESSDSSYEPLAAGTARVQWLDRYEPTIEKACDLRCLDRPLVAGDIVSRKEEPAALGTVAQVRVRADLRLRRARSSHRKPSFETLEQLEATSLRPVGGARLGEAVRSGRWVGRIVGASFDVSIRVGTSVCVVRIGDTSSLLEPVDDVDAAFDELCPVFPGQRVTGPPSVWRRAKWMPAHGGQRRRHRRQIGTVEKIAVVKYAVTWLAWSAGATIEQPPTFCDVGEVELLTTFFSLAGMPRAGDHVLLPDDRCGQVTVTHTSCRVRWNDDDITESDPWLEALDLVPRQQLGDHDFLPNDVVVPATVVSDDNDEDDSAMERHGVVRSVDAAQRTVRVLWRGPPDEEAIVSAYEVALHPSFQLSASDIVLKVIPGVGYTLAEEHDIARAIRASVVSLCDQSHAEWLGQVLASTRDGTVAVRWLDGSVTREEPSQLLVLPEAHADDEYEEVEVDEFDEDEEADELEEDADGEAHDGHSELETVPHDDVPMPYDDDADEDDGGEAAFAVCDSVPLDHAFLAQDAKPVPLTALRKLWAQLKKSLPAGVAVRTFEARSDLLRVVIFGPKDTPYEALIFLFDIQLPCAYPREPPAVFYHSMNATERLNPNLYENGKVCLSLLGTWSGPGWDPDNSTLLQLLVSLQGLVLVDKPYYNEPGNEKHSGTAEGELQARLYNENARLLALKATIPNLNRPPRPFKSLLIAYYRHRHAALRTHLAHPPKDASVGFKRVLDRIRPQFLRALEKLLRLPDDGA